MQRLPSILRKPTVALFWAWIALNIVLWLISIFDGSLHADMLRAVDYAVAEGSNLAQSRDAAAESFIYISFTYFVVTSLVGALLVHYSAAGSRWAFLVLIPSALWWAYESASAPITLGRMYPGTIHAWDWIVAGLGTAVWVFILGYTTRMRMKAAI